MAVDNINLNNLDKSDWKTYRFDEIANNISERVDPNNTDLEVYVGLEHIDSRSLQIRRFGTPDDVNGQKLKFYRGDIIFGRRRAYQRKASIAICDGLCSAHALVLRANSEVISPEIFPFFLHSDLFMNRAVDISVGSLSPTINWGTLKHQEFFLPPKQLQAQLAELLSLSDHLLQKQIELLKKATSLKNTKLKSIFSHGEVPPSKDYIHTEIGYMPKSWKIVEQGDVAEFINGRAYKKNEWEENGVPVIRLQNLTGTGEVYYYSNLDLPEKNYCYNGDLLYMWSATFGAKIWQGDKAIFHYHIWNIKCKKNALLQKYMYYNLEEITRRMMRQVSGSTMPHITKSGMEKLKIGLPSIDEQRSLIAELDEIEGTISDVKKNIKTFSVLMRSLVNKVF